MKLFRPRAHGTHAAPLLLYVPVGQYAQEEVASEK
jgi:hypothetical protein